MDILIVDDIFSETKVLERVLSKMGFEVGVALSAEDAILYIKNNHDIRMVIMDVVMPGVDGIMAAETIRNSLYNPVSIVGCSSDISSEQRQRCMESGMNSFLEKPYKMEQILALLKSHNLKSPNEKK